MPTRRHVNRTHDRKDGWEDPNPKDPNSKLHREHKPRAKKDTKRWCKGKEGVEHTLEVVFESSPWLKDLKCGYRKSFLSRNGDPKEKWFCLHETRCAVCGKVLKHRWEMPTEECPDFVEKK